MSVRWFALVFPLVSLNIAEAAVSCHGLLNWTPHDTTIDSADVIPAGQPIIADTPASKDHSTAICRVVGTIRPTSDSNIRFEVWLPSKGWNGKFLASGNGGFAGEIDYSAMSHYIKDGYVTAGTDTGHHAQGVDASWAYKHPEKIADYGYRAVHLMTVTAKNLLGSFYGKPADYSYFDSCSNGGREALMEAQRFPEDYDGILAGAPANNWTHMLAAGITEAQALYKNPASYISGLQLPILHRAVVTQCDAADGVTDGIIANPQACHFDPAVTTCKDQTRDACLTLLQAAAAKTLYSGTSLFPGLEPGSELESGGWETWVLGEGPGLGLFTGFVQNYFRYMVFDPTWNVLTADPQRSERVAEQKTGYDMNATDSNLTPLAKRGGKLIIYHGWDDPAISPLNSVNYYESVIRTVGKQAAAQVLRLYMVPGMQHCFGGPGPSAIGQLGIETSGEAKHGIMDTLQAWVENRTPPATVVATKYGENSKVLMTRPVCPYPQVPTYKGSGDTNDAGNFSCRQP